MAGGRAVRRWLAYGVVDEVRLQQLTTSVRLALHLPVLVALLALEPGARAGRVLLPQAALAAAWAAVVAACAVTGAASVATLAAAWTLALLRPAARPPVQVVLRLQRLVTA